MKVLKNFDIESVLPKDRSILIRELWNDFDPTTNLDSFKNQAKLWLTKFLTPSTGDPCKKGYMYEFIA